MCQVLFKAPYAINLVIFTTTPRLADCSHGTALVQIRELRAQVNCSRSHSLSEVEELDANPSILPRAPALTPMPLVLIAWTWRLTSLLINLLICESTLSFSFIAFVIALFVYASGYLRNVYIAILVYKLSEKPLSMCLAHGRYQINTCWVTISTLSLRRGMVVLVSTHVILTATQMRARGWS